VIAALLLCAGRGTRMRRTVPDKVLAPLAGRPVVLHSLAALTASGVVEVVVLVHRGPAQRAALANALAAADFAPPPIRWARGGRDRQDSVAAGLALVPEARLVLVHDAARPLVAPVQIAAVARAAARDGAAVLAHRVTDTIKLAPPTGARRVHRARVRTLPRDQLWAMETPQGFHRDLLVRALARATRRGDRVTDDAQAVELAGGTLTLVENTAPNPKLTSPADLDWIEFLLARSTAPATRPYRQ
jgi:2-C-methyl-D-erythritol 4-phosphate cytidylyltransferase